MEARTILVTQARSGSTRLPGKVLKEVGGKSLLEIHLERLNKCTQLSEIVVATTTQTEDEIIYNKALSMGFDSYRGSEFDVLDRFYQAVKSKNAYWIVRVTSDCPLIDPDLVDQVIAFVRENDADYGSNGLVERFPDGQDVEVFKFSALQKSWKNAQLQSEREHVTPYIRNNAENKGDRLFKIINYPCDKDFSKIRMTVDEPKDLALIERLINELGTDKTWLDYTNHIIENNLTEINNQIIRNEGFLKSLKEDING